MRVAEGALGLDLESWPVDLVATLLAGSLGGDGSTVAVDTWRRFLRGMALDTVNTVGALRVSRYRFRHLGRFPNWHLPAAPRRPPYMVTTVGVWGERHLWESCVVLWQSRQPPCRAYSEYWER
jgi:hypothetical protein